jgi:predicted SPOUT superfamily RNA methylase MTH1
LAGQVARAAAIYNVDEVVVFGDGGSGETGHTRSMAQLARVLQYLECPQYLRKHFFPIHDDLKYAGVLNPTDMPHHLRASEESLYREGVVVEREGAKEGTSFVNIGLKTDCLVDRRLKPGLRVTVRLAEGYLWDRKISGKIVSPSEPRTAGGLYWGYTTRLAASLSAVLAGCPHKGGYDLTIGTSEKGSGAEAAVLGPFGHLLVVLGGVGGLEAALEADTKLEAESPGELFDHYLDVCPDQGSRTIRTEEALLVTMATLRPKIVAANNG